MEKIKSQEELEESLVKDDQYQPVPKSTNCCCCFCTCIEQRESESKSFYIKKWRKYLEKEINKNEVENPFKILTNLWAHQNVIQNLENIRLNPNLMEPNQIRNDLEFYIPQICTFLVFGLRETVEEFLAFLCKACFASFYFAHRVIWFLQSLLQNDIMDEKENEK